MGESSYKKYMSFFSYRIAMESISPSTMLSTAHRSSKVKILDCIFITSHYVKL